MKNRKDGSPITSPGIDGLPFIGTGIYKELFSSRWDNQEKINLLGLNNTRTMMFGICRFNFQTFSEIIVTAADGNWLFLNYA